MKKTNLSERHSFASLSKGSLGDVQGRIFVNEVGINDLTNVEIVGTSVDTIRQLYYGKPKLHLVENYEAHIGEYLSLILPITLKHADYNAYQPCLAFHLCRMGKVSRYRFKLQNNELGIVILFGSYFAKMENFGQHLKIELSPKFISSHTSVAIQHWLDHFGLIFLDESVAKGCAVHLACDYQGFDLPTNFLDVFQTRSRIVQQYDGLNILDLSRVSSVVSSYGHGVNKGYLLGKQTHYRLVCIANRQR